jgi:hypothetical protein
MPQHAADGYRLRSDSRSGSMPDQLSLPEAEQDAKRKKVIPPFSAASKVDLRGTLQPPFRGNAAQGHVGPLVK